MATYYLIVTVLAMVQKANAINIDGQKLEVRKGYSVKTFESVVYGISKIQCAEACLRNREDGKCNLAGYHKGSRSCFLSLDDIKDVIAETDSDYSVIYIEPEQCPVGEYLVDGANPVSDSQLSVSSVWKDDPVMYGAQRARLNTTRTSTQAGTWCAGLYDTAQFIQVDFNSLVQVKGIALQGRPIHIQYVTSYKFLYGQDCVDFTTFQNTDGTDMVFSGNTDENTVLVTMLPYTVTAQCVRINPQTWNTHISLSFDILGCY